MQVDAERKKKVLKMCHYNQSDFSWLCAILLFCVQPSEQQLELRTQERDVNLGCRWCLWPLKYRTKLKDFGFLPIWLHSNWSDYIKSFSYTVCPLKIKELFTHSVYLMREERFKWVPTHCKTFLCHFNAGNEGLPLEHIKAFLQFFCDIFCL